MSSNSFVSTVDLTLRPSLRALQWLSVLHVVLIGLLPLAMQPGPMLWAMLALFAASWFGLRRHPVFGFGHKALVRLVWHAEGGWTLHDGAGRCFKAELLPGSYIHPQVQVLNFRSEQGKRYSRALLGDEATPELLRRLRARLLLERAAA